MPQSYNLIFPICTIKMKITQSNFTAIRQTHPPLTHPNTLQWLISLFARSGKRGKTKDCLHVWPSDCSKVSADDI